MAQQQSAEHPLWRYLRWPDSASILVSGMYVQDSRGCAEPFRVAYSSLESPKQMQMVARGCMGAAHVEWAVALMQGECEREGLEDCTCRLCLLCFLVRCGGVAMWGLTCGCVLQVPPRQPAEQTTWGYLWWPDCPSNLVSWGSRGYNILLSSCRT